VGSERVRAEIVRCVPIGTTFCLGRYSVGWGWGIKKTRASHSPAPVFVRTDRVSKNASHVQGPECFRFNVWGLRQSAMGAYCEADSSTKVLNMSRENLIGFLLAVVDQLTEDSYTIQDLYDMKIDLQIRI
jgi:hypothetical protein